MIRNPLPHRQTTRIVIWWEKFVHVVRVGARGYGKSHE
jgi:hypothetical protein